jgi:putative SOS response-associated peptidase YedK
MCGRYVIISKVKSVEKQFQASANFQWKPNYNLSAGQLAPVITSEKPQEIQAFHFGFTPSWSRKQTWVINARAEGDHNPNNEPNFRGSKGIIKKPFFRKSIRSKRCLVIADAFIEGTTKEKLKKPFLVYMRNKERPFAFGGVYDEWVNSETGEILKSFAIITCPPNSLMQKIPHHRMPVIIPLKFYKHYLNPNADLSEITALLEPYTAQKMNAYPIDASISKIKTNEAAALKPLGAPLLREEGFEMSNEIKRFGMKS